LDVNTRQRLAVARIKMGEVEEGKVRFAPHCSGDIRVEIYFYLRCTRISISLMMSSSMRLFLPRSQMRISSGIRLLMHVQFMDYLERTQGCVYHSMGLNVAASDHVVIRPVVSTYLCRRLPATGCQVI
jgi:hypothetical protein